MSLQTPPRVKPSWYWEPLSEKLEGSTLSSMSELETSELESDTAKPRKGRFRGRGPLPILSAWERALCRYTTIHYGISSTVLANHLDCSGPTIAKAVKNDYKKKDDARQDHTRLLKEKKKFESTVHKLLNAQEKLQAKNGENRSGRSNNTETFKYQAPIDVLHSAASGSTVKPSVPALSNLTTPALPAASHPASNFLFEFVACVPLDPVDVWYPQLKTAGLTEETLRRMAGILKEDLDGFVDKSFPEMTPVDRRSPKAVHQLRRVVTTVSTEVTALLPPSPPSSSPVAAAIVAADYDGSGAAITGGRAAIKPSPHHIAHQQHVPHVTPPLPHITPTPPPAVPTPDLEFINLFIFSVFSFDVLS
ncbi:hypothetical protein B0H16DRAFT_1882940 [Mycena metata]|uniref:Uncharacterized protein n=1 Tax=Mycena metata TaxID=1033252 RepID=A0AAD7JJE4_9AGAR|nr:hypothetical protein B0H16DRAFT_1882940 [Mycena metata]